MKSESVRGAERTGIDMTNKKLKSGRIYQNILLKQVLTCNLKNLMTATVCLYEMGVSKKKLTELIEDYNDAIIPGWEKASEADIQNVYVRRALSRISVNYDDVFETTKALSDKFDTRLIHSLTENLSIFFVSCNDHFGYGQQRIARLMEKMRNYKGNAIEAAKMLLDLKFEDDNGNLPDIGARHPKKERISREELSAYSRGLEAMRKIQNVG